MREPTDKSITLEVPEVRRLLSIAARWQFLSRLATEVTGMTDAKWEALLLRTRDDTHRAALHLVTLVHAAPPEAGDVDLEFADGLAVAPLVLSAAEMTVISELARRAIVASKLLRPLLTQLSENSNAWWDARKIVDRLDFDGRELLGYVRLINPDRVADIFAQLE